MTVITFPQKQYNEPVMVPGMGAQPMPSTKYVPANDNVPQPDYEVVVYDGFTVGGLISSLRDAPPWTKFHTKPREMASGGLAPGGQYIGLRRSVIADSSKGGFDIPPELQPAFVELARHGDFMQTATGRKFWPMDPRSDEVFIEDIAHSLSLQCRYAGHCLHFYSVAEHSVLMARKLRWEGVDVALHALLHDASEAYLVDVPRPVKPYLDGYKAAEAKVMAAVCDRFSLAREMPAVVHDADNRIIADELVNLVPMEWHGKHDNPLGVELRYWSPEKAKEEFIATFEALMDGRARGMGA